MIKKQVGKKMTKSNLLKEDKTNFLDFFFKNFGKFQIILELLKIMETFKSFKYFGKLLQE